MRLGLGICLWLLATAAQAAGCPAGSVQVGQREERTNDAIVVHPLCRRVPTCDTLPATPADVEREYLGLRRELEQNVNEAARNADVLDEWAALGANAREDARKRALGLAVEQSLTAAAAKASAAMREAEISSRISAGLGREWGSDVARLSKMSDETKAMVLAPVNNARTAQQGITGLKNGIKTIKTSYTVGEFAVEPNWLAFKKAALSTLKLTQSLLYANPATALLIADLESTENAAYGWWAAMAAHSQLERFIGLEDDLLKEAIRESSRYVTLSTAMAAIRRGEPYCAAPAVA